LDYDLLHVITDKKNFIRFKPYIKEHLLSREAAVVVASIEGYFTANPSETQIKWEPFETYFLGIKGSKLRREEVDLYKLLFIRLKTGSPSTSADDLLKHYITTDYSSKIVDTAIKVADGEKDCTLDDVGILVTDYVKEVGRAITKTDLFAPTDVASVVKAVSTGGYEWRLEELNISIGPLRQGDFVVIGARPEIGKTTFMADQVSYMAQQIKEGRPVIWVNNEERSDKVMFRIIQAALGRKALDIVLDPVDSMSIYTKMMGNKDKILVVSEASGISSVNQLNSLFKDMNPALIVFDQLDKVEGFSGEDRDDLRLGRLYLWARKLAHEYGPVIAASQADATAEGQKWIYQDQLRGSKVDKPGEVDVIITIGKTHEKSEEFNRYIHVPKNKLFGGPRTVEKERHGYWEVKIKPEIARYEGTH
jgi:replicative DNA helicase